MISHFIQNRLSKVIKKMEAKYQETKKESKPSSGKEEINVIELLEEDDEFEVL